MDEFSSIFKKIKEGASIVKVDALSVYLKHPNVDQQSDYYDIYEKSFSEYRARNVPTNEEADQLILDQELWTAEDEKELKLIEDELERMKGVAKFETIPSKKIGHTREIKKIKEALEKKKAIKLSLRPLTAEMGANLKVNDMIITKSFFRDKACNNPLFTDDDYQEMNRRKIDELTQIYTSEMDFLSEDKIQKLVLSDFFAPLFSIYTTPHEMFGIHSAYLTRPQATLCVYVKIFKSIFENIPKIPKNIAKDPEALLEFAENYNPSEGISKSTKARDSDVGHRVVFGANKSDVQEMARPNEAPMTLEELAANVQDGGSARLMDIFNSGR